MLHRLIINLACSTLALVFLTYPAVSQAVTPSDSNEQINDNSRSEISQEEIIEGGLVALKNSGTVRYKILIAL